MGYTLNETKYNSPNYTPAGAVAATYGMGRTIRGVTIHHWGVDGQSIDGISSYLCRAGGNTSAHFSLQDGLVYCLVSPEDAAWHAGSAEGNATTIGIECRPEMTDGDLRTLVEFIQWLESVYGSLNIYRHRDWSSTECPGRYAGQLDWIVNQVNAGSTPASPSTGGGSIEAAIGWFTDRAGAVTYSMDYRNGPGSYDCSSSIYYALAAAGINTSGKVGNTETMFSDLPAWGFQEVFSNGVEIPTQRGDIFIWGDRGASSGAAGHTGIFADSENIWHCNFGYNGITLNNHDYIWDLNRRPSCHIFRYSGGGTASTVQKASISKDWFDMASRQDLAEVTNDVIHANEGFFRQLTHKVLFDEKFDRQGSVNGKPVGGTTTFALEAMYAAQNFGRLKADVLWAQKQIAELSAEVKELKEEK